MTRYTSLPTHLRIQKQLSRVWTLDGVDNTLQRVTKPIESFNSLEEAIAGIPDFLERCELNHIFFLWDKNRPHRSRHVNPLSRWQHHCTSSERVHPEYYLTLSMEA